MKRLLLFLILFFIPLVYINAQFVENFGQFDKNVQYLFRDKFADIWIGDDFIVFDYKNLNGNKLHRSAIKMDFVGKRNFTANAIHHNPLQFNYFMNNRFITNTKTFDTLIIKEIYDKIDLILYEKNGCFAYDFLLNPGADPSQIIIKIDGADEINAIDNTLKVSFGNYSQIHTNLSAFYDNSKQKINAVFQINFLNLVQFKLDKYDKTKSIRIDPIVYSTYFGGTSYDYLRGLAIDSLGNLIAVGRTRSTDFPTKYGSYDTTFSDIGYDFYDAVITKFSPDGKSVIFSSFLGGMGDDYAEAIACDLQGNIYVTGYTMSLRSFPFTSNALDTFDIGGYDGFLTVFSPQGNSIIFSTLFGGKSDDYPQSIALDRDRNIYITGYTISNDFRVTAGAFDTVYNQPSSSGKRNDAFAVKFNNNFTLGYSTYIGGSGDDFGQAIAVDTVGNAIIAGITRSADFPVSNFAYQKILKDSLPQQSTGDGFIIKLNRTGKDKVFSTYFGGLSRDAIYSIAIDQNQNIYVAGYTETDSLAFADRSYQKRYSNRNTGTILGDAFIAKLKPTGDSLLNFTYFGGTGSERIASLTIDKYNFVLACGFTTSRDLKVTQTAFQKNYSDSTDGFVARFTPNLDYCIYLTYLGGKRSDIANSILPLDSAYLWVAGFTNSVDFPTSQDALFAQPKDNFSEMFLTKLKAYYLDLDFSDAIGSRIVNICKGDSIYIGAQAIGGIGNITYQWQPIDGVSQPDSSFTFLKPDSSKIYYLTATDEFGNTVKDSVKIIVHNKPNLSIFGSTMVLTNSIEEYILTSDIQGTTTWYVTDGSIIEQSSTKIKVRWNTQPSIGKLKAVFISIYGCIDSLQLNIRIGTKPRPKIKYSGKFPPCLGDTLLLDAGDGYISYLWSNGDTNQTISITENGKYFVIVKDSLGFIGVSDTLNIYFMVYPTPVIYGLNIVKPNIPYTYFVEGSPGSTFNWIINGGIILSGQGSDTIFVRWSNTPSGSLRVEEHTKENCTVFSDLFTVDISGIFKPKIRVLGSTNICDGDSILLDAGYGYSYYRWNNGSTKRFIFVSTADTFYCYVKDSYGFEGFTDTIMTKILERPPKPEVSVFGNQFTCLVDSLPIQWYYNDQVIPNANGTLYIADIPGYYKVCVRGYNGCQSCSNVIAFMVSVAQLDEQIEIYPNPCDNFLNLKLSEELKYTPKIKIYNLLMENVLSIEQNKLHNIQIDVSKLSRGVYLLVIEENGKFLRYYFVKN